MNEWISIAANIGTAVAASLAFLALREMKQQRAQADKPKLLLSPVQKSLHVYWTEIKDPFPAILPLRYIPSKAGPRPHKINTKKNTTDLDDALNKLVEGIKLELINAGLGPAVEVNIDWTTEQPISRLAKDLNKSKLPLEIEYGEGKHAQLRMKGKNGGGPLIFVLEPGGVLRTEFPYLLPYSNSETNKRMITIPHALLMILLLVLTIKTLIPSAKRVDFDKYALPRLHCNISFRDRAGRKHQNSFMLEFKISSITALGRIPPEPGTVCASLKVCLSLK